MFVITTSSDSDAPVRCWILIGQLVKLVNWSIGQTRAELTGVRFRLPVLTGRAGKKHCTAMLFSARAVNTGRVLGWPVGTTRVDGAERSGRVHECNFHHPSTRPERSTRQLGPSTRVVGTGLKTRKAIWPETYDCLLSLVIKLLVGIIPGIWNFGGAHGDKSPPLPRSHRLWLYMGVNTYY